VTDEESPDGLMQEALVSCAAAEGVLRGMLVRLDFSADELLSRHLEEFDGALDAIARRGVRLPGVEHLTAAREALRAAGAAFDPWRFSSDPEYAHLPRFQRESLRLLESVTSEREAAAAELSEPRR
jgi:hypothetical protein